MVGDSPKRCGIGCIKEVMGWWGVVEGACEAGDDRGEIRGELAHAREYIDDACVWGEESG
jgi:hypothetical protein